MARESSPRGDRSLQCGQSLQWAGAGPQATVTFHPLPWTQTHTWILSPGRVVESPFVCATPRQGLCFQPRRVPHWDVKPQNLLTGDKGTARLADPGLARAARGRLHTRGCTTAMAPWSARGSPPAGIQSAGAMSAELAAKEPLSMEIQKSLCSSELSELWAPSYEVWPGRNRHRTKSTFPKWKPEAQQPNSKTL